MMLDKVEAAFQGADALREALRTSAGKTPAIHIRPHVICQTTGEAETLVSLIAETMDGEQVEGPELSVHAASWEVGTVSVSGLLSHAQRDRYMAVQNETTERAVIEAVLG